jgi:tRNA(Ser,Leu) C12 N-acetylase TAN1
MITGDRGAEPNLLVSASWRAPGRARREICARLRALGDPAAAVTSTSRKGLLAVTTRLDPRDVIPRLRALHAESPGLFRATCRWVPVDRWTAPELEAMRQGVEQLRARIAPTDRWRLTVAKRVEGGPATRAIIEALAGLIEAPVDLSQPDRILLVEVFADRAALSVLAPADVFSVPPARRHGLQPGPSPRAVAATPGEEAR